MQAFDLGFRDGAICLVFEFCTTDLEVIINDSSMQLTQPIIKAYLQMMLSSVAHLHQLGILHRVRRRPPLPTRGSAGRVTRSRWTGYQAQQLFGRSGGHPEADRLWHGLARVAPRQADAAAGRNHVRAMHPLRPP